MDYENNLEAKIRKLEAENRELKIKLVKSKEEAGVLPNDSETEEWFDININDDCSASSAIYKFRLWLADRLAAFGKDGEG